METKELSEDIEEELDSDITSIRAEIRNLQRRKRFLTSSLLSSESLQNRIKSQTAPSLSSLTEDISPLVRSAGIHADVNHHRIAFSATTFPFKDPSPNTEDPNLLGVRIDICARNGRFVKPYYLLLRQSRGEEKWFQVHRHTIPAFISMETLERMYLPLSNSSAEQADSEEMALKPSKKKPRKQSLQGLVRELRRQLVAWHLRVDAVSLLRETLGVVRRGIDDYDDDDDGVWERNVLGDSGEEMRLAANDLGIVSLAPTSLEAVYVRLEWADGRVGRFKISNSGIVERAVVIGDNGRDKAVEVSLTGGDGRVETVLDRLKRHAPAKE
ncbi:hypothetical protein EYZ11_008758 [Aspergillus tanneri]|uniref:Cenp-O kinetochore centromere component n=1 Tax=Aspergillus tanneri TaxID=1220188 RepID=A0A4S3J9T9_9EURO|nr:uncharacterized protein ATNIH1004_007226 [Aspergillus tanneri]KAA8645806.1 hypothetical protein ATNIH1004_007226 [Aspergillus tanneri]THC91780.1 hypothetical protein EYZ11_008758 [Aspergillus tanneri]